MKGGINTLIKTKALNKKGVLGLDTAKSFILALLVLGVVSFTVIIALNQLALTNVGTAQTTSIFNNISNGIESFFGNTGTWFAMLSIVIIILVIAVVILAVNRFGGSGVAGGSGGL